MLCRWEIPMKMGRDVKLYNGVKNFCDWHLELSNISKQSYNRFLNDRGFPCTTDASTFHIDE